VQILVQQKRQITSLSMHALSKARIGILGGTFDPIHNGHIAVALRFIECLNLTELVLLPAGQPWQKIGVSSAEHRLAMTQLAAHELESLLHAQYISSAKSPIVRVANDEIERAGPSYMVETLAAWRAHTGMEPSLTLIIGDDQLVHLDSWHAWPTLFDYAHIGVACRAGYRNRDDNQEESATISTPSEPIQDIVNPAFAELPLSKVLAKALIPRKADAIQIQSLSKGLIFLDDVPMPALSSTQIRKQIAHSAHPSDLGDVPRAVSDYIFEHHLYRTEPYGYLHT
jgi:nicotinate-nucleotide adenylyltransferase